MNDTLISDLKRVTVVIQQIFPLWNVYEVHVLRVAFRHKAQRRKKLALFLKDILNCFDVYLMVVFDS